MAKKTLKELSKIMSDVDICMLTTVNGRGAASARPMSNNGDVKYNGTSYFFTWKKTKMAKEIENNNNVTLTFQGTKLFQKLFITIIGKGKLVTDRATMDHHWNKDLEIWFKDGLDTPGITMIEVKAKTIEYWHGEEQGELKIK